ncbi:MAG: beta-galactosidase, partial [Phycisphaerales bacterium]|nr:beta-galactosidase [Phycisphaerales bacterium]
MPISYDAQAFTIDGRRTRLVSGTLCPSRIPPEEWDARLHDARMAGLNCVEVVVHWARHEPWPGALDFTGSNDIAAFLRLAHARGLLAILRVGPFVNAGFDLGGLPPWLLGVEQCTLRSADEAWIAHATTFLTALARHIAPLQRTASPEGPVVLVQVEHEWLCGDDDLAEEALSPYGRALRESGIDVPIVNRDNLYHAPVVSSIEGWNDHETPHAVARQMHFLAPDAPRLLLGVRPGHASVWGRKETPVDPGRLLRHLAEGIAAGAQVNIDPFFAGTAFGFDGGRLADGPDAFLHPVSGPGGSLLEADGRFGAAALAARRLCTFATSFHRTLCNLDADDQPVVVSPHDGGCVSVVPSRGRQGSLVWIFSPASGAPKSVHLTLPDGETTEVHLLGDGVSWVLQDVHLFERTTLDLCTLNAFALVGRTLVVYGRAGTTGTISINGATAEVTVPRGHGADIEQHEGVTLVICNESSIDTTWWRGDVVHVGVAGLDPSGEPLPHEKHRTCRRVDGDGVVQRVRMAAAKTTGTPRLRSWSVAGVDAWVDGTS